MFKKLSILSAALFAATFGYASNNATQYGTNAKATANESSAVGERAEATAQNSSAFGSDTKASGVSSLAVGTGSRATADTAVALGNDSATTAKSAVALGGSAKANHNFGVALGDSSETKQQTIVTSATVNGINYGNFAGTDGSGAVSVGKSDFSRQIQHVGAGEISKTSTDAINGSQLYAVAEQVGTNAQSIASNKTAINNNAKAIAVNKAAVNSNKQAISDNKQATVTNAKNISANASQINANRVKIDKLSNGVAQANKRIDSLSDDVRKHRKLASAGIAGAVAVANIPHATYAGKSALGVGVGGHGGQQALAVRYSRLSDNTKWLVSVSGSVDTQSQVTYGAGLTYQFQ